MPTSPELKKAPEKNLLRHIRDLAQEKVIHSDTFQRERALIYKETGDLSQATATAFRIAADAASLDKENGLSQADRSLLKVTGQLGVFAEAREELGHIYADDGLYPTARERQIAKNLKEAYLIPFNHALKDLINTHPNADFRSMTSALAGAHNMIFSSHTAIDPSELVHAEKPQPVDVARGIEDCLNGMRHEVAAETMLAAAGIDYDYNISVEEDATGTDLLVHRNKWEGVDTKASQSSALRAQGKHPLSRAVWTGLTPADFTGQKGVDRNTLSIPFSVAEEKCDTFVTAIDTMVERNHGKRDTMTRRSGSHTLSRV